ncbi:hypothetical protein N7481_009931 [Penicillium waksmanii]|uniref:uncharacterized protein n=1 Tax=Penicillium waksmanii TaxID=69791 RepID=UPI002546EA9A|nr:uncharacterized protein N7481_009931 [Penicillium waksmanii]KAJ5976224.1 hypothetical protein N7481_009931 [Penicillium waksmanii]
MGDNSRGARDRFGGSMGEKQHNQGVAEQKEVVFADKARDSHHDSAKEGDEEVFARSVDWPFGRERFEGDLR